MSRYQHSKSSLFLMELIFNLLLFCVLCACGLLFFIKSDNMTKDTTTLSHAVSITSSVANVYENGNGSISGICHEYADAVLDGDKLFIYFDEHFKSCKKADSIYYVLVEGQDSTPSKVSISFYDNEDALAYSITACHYKPSTLTSVKEVALP